MSGQASSSTRARDIDRAQTCGVLDAGYSEGQLDTTEHDARTAAAMKAKTLGELDALVSDLQIPAHLVETALRTATAPRRLRRGPVIAAAIAAVAVVIGTVFFVARDDETAQTPAAPEVVAAAEEPAPLPAPIPGEPDAIVIEPIDTTTVEGIRAFIDRYRAKFKHTLVDRAIFYPERASVDRAVDGAPHLYQRYDFMNGFKPSMTPSGRGPDTQAIDLADIDLDRLAANLATAPDRVRLSTGRIGDIDVRTTGGEAEVAISVESPDKRSGSVYTTLGGDEIDVRTADR